MQVAKLEKIETPANDTLDIDLLDLKAKGLLKNTQVVVVNEDPVYHKTKKFNALPLKAFLEEFSSVETLNIAETKVVFECEDGYKPECYLQTPIRQAGQWHGQEGDEEDSLTGQRKLPCLS